MSEKKIVLTPSQRRMVLSEATVVVLIGPKGEGKTYAALPSIFYHSRKFPEPIRGAIVRDRFTNIQRHTIPSIIKAVGNLVSFHRDGALMRGPNFEADLFGVDDLGDVQNIHGSEYMWVWIEEPAPVFEVGSAGIREEVFDMIYARGGRSEGAVDKVFVTMNPASKAHWTWKRFVLHPEPDFEVIRIPYGENPHLPAKEREKTKRAFKHRPDLFTRYVKGEFASVSLGQAVTPEFSEMRHRSLAPLIPSSDLLTFRFWDGGLFPTCVFVQIHPNGQVVVYKTLRGNDIGMKQHISLNVLPYIAQTEFRKVREWRDLGDPSLMNRDPMDSNLAVSQIIEQTLDTVFEPGEMLWENRKEVLKDVLTRDIDGQPRLLVNYDDDIMVEALGGGWHYHKNSSGQVLMDKPMKDIHSHPGDALSHGLGAILIPASDKRPRQVRVVSDFNVFDDDRSLRSQDLFDRSNDDWSPYHY